MEVGGGCGVRAVEGGRGEEERGSLVLVVAVDTALAVAVRVLNVFVV